MLAGRKSVSILKPVYPFFLEIITHINAFKEKIFCIVQKKMQIISGKTAEERSFVMTGKKTAYMLLMVTICLFALAGCGNGGDNGEGSSQNVNQSTENGKDKKNLLSPGEFGSTDKKNELTEGSTEDLGSGEGMATGGEEGGTGSSGQNSGNAGNMMEEAGERVGDAVDDVADGVGDAIDNLGGGSFEKYEDAKKYLLDKLHKDNVSANYEVREETEDLTAYNGNDEGAEAYKFSVYETDGNEKIGIYYVDKDTGKIYRYMGKNSIEAY